MRKRVLKEEQAIRGDDETFVVAQNTTWKRSPEHIKEAILRFIKYFCKNRKANVLDRLAIFGLSRKTTYSAMCFMMVMK
ncbi:unnamed protein product [Caenorhabditis nigoni]